MRLNRIFQTDGENSIKRCAFVLRSDDILHREIGKTNRDETKIIYHMYYDGVIICVINSNLFFFKDFIIKYR